jgi:endonuclease/exonuclease/phosphatase family metal-dependent hydrolase
MQLKAHTLNLASCSDTPEHKEARDVFISGLDADILALQSVEFKEVFSGIHGPVRSQVWLPTKDTLLTTFTDNSKIIFGSSFSAEGEHNTGNAIYLSPHLQLINASVLHFDITGDIPRSALIAKVMDEDASEFLVINTQLTSGDEHSVARSWQLKRITDFASLIRQPVLLMGDMGEGRDKTKRRLDILALDEFRTGHTSSQLTGKQDQIWYRNLHLLAITGSYVGNANSPGIVFGVPYW